MTDKNVVFVVLALGGPDLVKPVRAFDYISDAQRFLRDRLPRYMKRGMTLRMDIVKRNTFDEDPLMEYTEVSLHIHRDRKPDPNAIEFVDYNPYKRNRNVYDPDIGAYRPQA